MRGTVPTDRSFGIDTSILDLPANLAKPKIITEFAKSISRFEPRARLKSCTFNDNVNSIADGSAFCNLTLDIDESKLRGGLIETG